MAPTSIASFLPVVLGLELCVFSIDAFVIFPQTQISPVTLIPAKVVRGTINLALRQDPVNFVTRNSRTGTRFIQHAVRSTAMTVQSQAKLQVDRNNVKRTVVELEELLKTVTALVQQPIDGGCPWTAEQQALGILEYVKAEVDEIGEELMLGPASPHYALLSELGDLLFCSFLLIKICERDKLGDVNLAGAAAFASAKVKRRAPFVFNPQENPPSSSTLLTAAEASAIWKRIKGMEKAGLIPICPDGYDYVNGTCRLSDQFFDCIADEGTAASTADDVTSKSKQLSDAAMPAEGRDVVVTQGDGRWKPEVGFSSNTGALLCAFAAGLAIGMSCTTWVHLGG